MSSKRTFARGVVLAVIAALLLIFVAVTRHPASIQGTGKSLLITDGALLLLYGIAGAWVWQQRRSKVMIALSVAATIGLALCGVHIANHLIELFVADRPFVIVIAPVLLTFALLGTAGSISYDRTHSLTLAVISGLWCAMAAMLFLLCFAFSSDLAFEGRAELPLRGAFLASSMNDPGAFLVKNSLQAASEGLIRMPIFGVFLSLIGAVVHAWIARRTRTTALVVTLVTSIMFAMGVVSLWYADTLERAARPPFVIFGVLMAGISLSSAHPAWSALRHKELLAT